MSERTPQSLEEIQNHFLEQIRFIEMSCASFDAGFEAEAKRLASTMRLLLHQTKHSKALLAQLGMEGRQFVDTAFPLEPASLLTHGGLVFQHHGPAGITYVAMLDDVPRKRFVTFEEWWNSPIFRDADGHQLSRKDLVLVMANQDGGVHVDPALDPIYYSLSRGNSLGWVVEDNGNVSPMDGAEKVAVRQIAHELLKSLKPGYEKMPQHQPGVVFGDLKIMRLNKQSHVEPDTQTDGLGKLINKVGRNKPCPCGSGVKYKRCHGKM